MVGIGLFNIGIFLFKIRIMGLIIPFSLGVYLNESSFLNLKGHYKDLRIRIMAIYILPLDRGYSLSLPLKGLFKGHQCISRR